MSSKGGGLAASKVEEFRVVLRAVALDTRTNAADILINTLDDRALYDSNRRQKVMDVRAFIDGMSTMKEIRHKFTSADLADIFNEADESEVGSLSLYDLIDFVDKTVSRARTIALKLRSAILKQFKTEADYTAAFSTVCNHVTRDCDKENFTQFAEDLLQISITESDALALYTLFDTDESGRVSIDDFVGFISGQNTEAYSILSTGDPEDIVDMRISGNSKMDADYLRMGYEQVTPRLPPGSTYDFSTKGSFGLGESLWIWRRKQGTCGGRLKPIIDIQATNKARNSPMVISGYQNLRGSINNKRIWIRRATTHLEHEEALVDVTVTIGRPSTLSDPIHTPPGSGWIMVDRVDNEKHPGFATKFMSSQDAFLWMLPIRTRTTDLGNVTSMQRAVSTMSSSKKKERALHMCRMSIRNYVPYEKFQQECCPNMFRKGPSSASTVSQKTATAQPGYADAGLVGNFNARKDSMNTMVTKVVRRYDFSDLFLDYSQQHGPKTLTSSTLERMLKHVGCYVDNETAKYVFAYFDTAQTGYLSREDFAEKVSLNEYELDHRIELIRLKMLNRGNLDAAIDDVADIDASTSMKISESMKSRSKHSEIRDAKLFAQVFQIVNTDRDGILSLIEFQEMLRAMEIYLTDEESRKVLVTMDLSGNDRVEESDFVGYLRKRSEVVSKLAHRLRDEANSLRRWLQRGGVSYGGEGGKAYGTQAQWADLTKRHKYFAPSAPTPIATLDPDDLMMALGYLNRPTTPKGARDIMLMVSPDGNGRVSEEELGNFMNRSTRTFGELLALMERDVMKPIYDAFLAYQAAKKQGSRDADKAEAAFGSFLREVVTEVSNSSGPIKTSPRATDAGAAGGGSDGQEIVSVGQLKAGIEAAVRRYKEIDGTAPNVEEWACLAVLTGASVTENGIFGVRPLAFVESMCVTISMGAGKEEGGLMAPSMTSLDRLVREVQRLIRETAIQAGNGAAPDYRAAFNVINTDGDEVLSVKELKAHLARLHLSDMCPDEEVPQFVRMIDKSNQGYVTFDDFMKFVEENKNSEVGDSRRADDENDETDPAKMSGEPPVAITKNADCDYLLWFVWRQACRIEPQDPEIIVTELESACTETELSQVEGTISVKELWNLMFELKIQTQNNISKAQFEKGTRYLVNDPRDLDPSSTRGLSSHDVQVDYRALARYVIRMGRAHEAQVEEKRASDEAKYRQLKGDLRRFLRSLDQEDHAVTGYTPRDLGVDSDANNAAQLRFERVFKRLDSDGDGKITAGEFKIGLRRLGYKQEKMWTTSITKLLFVDIDSDRDGTLSLRELVRLVRDDGDNTSPRSTYGGSTRDNAEASPRYSSYYDRGGAGGVDDEDDVFSKGVRSIGENELFFKAYSVLKEMVPSSSTGNFEGVKNAVRRFFLRSDTDNRGWVSEERFRAFLRRSSLADKMTSGELRRMTESLVQRHIVKSPSGMSATQNEVDYEKLITLMEAASETGPSTKSDLVLLKLRDAAGVSAQAGRPFLSLCTLVDSTNTGRVTKDEMVLACKMMGAHVTASDLETLRDDMLEGTFASDGSVDYKEVNYLITKEAGPGLGGTAAPGHSHSHSHNHGSTSSGTMLNLGPSQFSRPQAHTHSLGAATTGGGGMDGDYYTPRGNLYDRLAATTPFTRDAGAGAGGRSSSPYMSPGRGGGGPSSEMGYLLDRIRAASEDKARKWSGRSAYTGNASESYSLLRQLAMFDINRTRSVPTRDFVAIVEDLGVPLSNADIRSLQSAYSGEGHDSVAYEPFCRDVMGGPVPAAGGGREAGQGAFTPAYLQAARVLGRFADLKAEGRNPRDMFEAYDLDVTGLVEAWRFKEVMHRLNLILPEFINEAGLDFAALGGGDNVSYDDFCRVLEVAAKEHEFGGGQVEGMGMGIAGGDRERGASYRTRDFDSSARGRGGFTGGRPDSREDAPRDPLNNDNVDRWLSRSASPKQKREFENIYDDLARFKDEQRGDRTAFRGSRDFSDRERGRGRDRDFPLTLDEGSEFDSSARRLRPPAVSSSRDFDFDDRDRVRGRSPMSRSGTFERSSHEGTRRSMERERDRYRGESPKPPRASPSKVGSKMWGSHTSLDLKGKSVSIDEGHWTCPVCLYVENDSKSDKCLICNTPNYNNRPDFQVKEQCSNCTFLNGQYATECEMCGLPLGKSSSVL